jgi:hypothetical protein
MIVVTKPEHLAMTDFDNLPYHHREVMIGFVSTD